MLGSRPELLSEFYKTVSPALIARFKGTNHKIMIFLSLMTLSGHVTGDSEPWLKGPPLFSVHRVGAAYLQKPVELGKMI